MAASTGKADVLYSTDFEASTFTVGAIAGQDGWSVFGSSDAASIGTSSFFPGQAAFVLPANATGQTGPFKTVSSAAPIVIQSGEIYLFSSSTQSQWQFAAVGAGLIGFAGGINILPDDSIQAITGAFPIIGTFTRNQFNKVDLVLNYLTQTYTIILNGLTIASDLPFCGSNNGCTGANVASYEDGLFDTFAGVTDVNDLGALDNYSVSTPADVPEPASLPLLGAALAALVAVRRRRAAQ